MASKYDKTSLDLLLGFQTRLQGVGNSLAADLAKIISSTDAAVLKTVINQLPSGSSSVKTQMRELEKMVKEIERIRKEGFDLAEMEAFAAGPEIVKRAGETVAKIADNRGKIFKKELTDKQISDVLNYHPIDGKSISQWFHAMKTNDLERITQTVQRATVEGMSVAKVVKAIRGTKENDYKDGVLETTRQAATMTARTVVNGVASNAMLETCVQNADVIDGVKFIAPLDAKTCPFCGSYDGKVWKPEDAALVKRPPLHPNCRCTVIPYVDMGPELEGERPAAAADFDKLAQDAYNKQAREKGWKRRFDDLSPSTRLKYYYQAQKDYTKQTGKPAYSQVNGDTTFKDYFEKQDEAFQRSWLGPKRFALYQQGKYDPLHLANPDTGYVATLDELKKQVEPEAYSLPITNSPSGPAQPGNNTAQAPLSTRTSQGIPTAEEVLSLISSDEWTRQRRNRIEAEIILLKKTNLSNLNASERRKVKNRISFLRKELRQTVSEHTLTSDAFLDAILPIDNPNSTNRGSVKKVNFEENLNSSVFPSYLEVEGFTGDKGNTQQGLDLAARLMDNTSFKNVGMDKIAIRGTRVGASFCYNYKGLAIYLDTSIKPGIDTKTTTAHEAGHALETLLKKLHAELSNYLLEITTDNSGKRTTKKTLLDRDGKPLKRFGKVEYYHESTIKIPTDYAVKDYGGKATELLSIFLEYLGRDPGGLVKDYPDFYNGIVGCLNRAAQR